MRNKCWLLASLLTVILPVSCHGGIIQWIGNAYAELQPNGSDTTYYWINESDGVNPAFSPNLGGLSIQYGQALLLGGQAQTWEQGYGVATTMYYKIDTGSFNSMNLSWAGTRNNNDLWEQSPAVNINNGLSVGSHTLSIYFMATQGGTTLNDGNSISYFSANFNVVPEPINVALGTFAVLFLTIALLRSQSVRRLFRAS